MYCDTDSVIFVEKEGENLMEIGNYLGDFTNELKIPGNYITRFSSAGPKNYAFETKDPLENDIKIKGITLSVQNREKINVDEMVKIITTKDKILFTNDSKITRNNKTKEIYNKKEAKEYKLVYTKAVIKDLEEGYKKGKIETIPFGY